MDVIIVSKTHMSSAACVGGVLANGRFVRLLNSDGYNQDSDTDIEVGDVYTITFSERTEKTPPHVEDILVHSMEHKFSFSSIDKMVEYLTESKHPFKYIFPIRPHVPIFVTALRGAGFQLKNV